MYRLQSINFYFWNRNTGQITICTQIGNKIGNSLTCNNICFTGKLVLFTWRRWSNSSRVWVAMGSSFLHCTENCFQFQFQNCSKSEKSYHATTKNAESRKFLTVNAKICSNSRNLLQMDLWEAMIDLIIFCDWECEAHDSMTHNTIFFTTFLYPPTFLKNPQEILLN